MNFYYYLKFSNVQYFKIWRKKTNPHIVGSSCVLWQSTTKHHFCVYGTSVAGRDHNRQYVNNNKVVIINQCVVIVLSHTTTHTWTKTRATDRYGDANDLVATTTITIALGWKSIGLCWCLPFFFVVQMNHTKTVQHSRTLTRSVCEIQLRSVIDFFASAIAEWQSESEFVIIAYLSFYVCGNTWFDDYQKQNKLTPCSVELIPVSSSALTLLYSRNPLVWHARSPNHNKIILCKQPQMTGCRGSLQFCPDYSGVMRWACNKFNVMDSHRWQL